MHPVPDPSGHLPPDPEDLEDIRLAEQALAEYRASGEQGMTLQEVAEELGIELEEVA